MKPKRLIFLLVLLLPSVGRAAEATDSLATKLTIDLGLALSQTTYSNNWAGGDAGSVAWVANGNVAWQRQFVRPWHLRNTLRLAYGQSHTQDAETHDWRAPFKSTDLIDFEALLRYMGWKALPPYGALRIISQFEDASVQQHRRYINPISITESFGLSREVYKKGDDELLSRVGLGLRHRIDRILTDTAAGDTKTETTNDGGVEWVTDGKYKIPKSQVAYRTKLTVFKAFFNSRSDELKGAPNEDYWKAVDVNWENTLSAQVAKFVVVTLELQWLYDKEIDLGGRFKQTLTLGLTWKKL